MNDFYVACFLDQGDFVTKLGELAFDRGTSKAVIAEQLRSLSRPSDKTSFVVRGTAADTELVMQALRLQS